MKTFIAAFKRGNEKPKYISNALDHKGYLVSKIEVGKGKSWEEGYMIDGEGNSHTVYERYETEMRPYFDALALKKDGLNDVVRKQDVTTFNKAVALGYEKYLIKFGKHSDYEVWNTDERKEQEFLSAKKVSFVVHNCWETGLNWYQLSGHKYPIDVFNAMKPYLRYHSEQEEEEGNWKGWCTTHNTLDIEKAIKPLGWTI